MCFGVDSVPNGGNHNNLQILTNVKAADQVAVEMNPQHLSMRLHYWGNFQPHVSLPVSGSLTRINRLATKVDDLVSGSWMPIRWESGQEPEHCATAKNSHGGLE